MKKLGNPKYKETLKEFDRGQEEPELQEQLSKILFNPDLDVPFTW